MCDITRFIIQFNCNNGQVRYPVQLVLVKSFITSHPFEKERFLSKLNIKLNRNYSIRKSEKGQFINRQNN